MRTLKVTFRYVVKLDRVVMFYYDEYRQLVEVSFQEGHNDVSVDYYHRATKPCLNLELIELDAERFARLYSGYVLVYKKRISVIDNLKKEV